MPDCPGCGTHFSYDRYLTKHKKKCQAIYDQARIGYERQRAVERAAEERAAKRPRLDTDISINTVCDLLSWLLK